MLNKPQQTAAEKVLSAIQKGVSVNALKQNVFVDDIPNLPYNFQNKTTLDFIVNVLKTIRDDSSLSQALIDHPENFGYPSYLYTFIANEFIGNDLLLDVLDEHGFTTFYDRRSEVLTILVHTYKIHIYPSFTPLPEVLNYEYSPFNGEH